LVKSEVVEEEEEDDDNVSAGALEGVCDKSGAIGK
jgi:hypothetical protein